MLRRYLDALRVNERPPRHDVTDGLVGVRKRRTRNKGGRFINERWVRSHPCPTCGKIFRPNPSTQKHCSMPCARQNTRYVDQAGYVVVKMPDHPHATTNGWVREHQVVATQMLGRPLRYKEQVHHRDGNKKNNRPENLEVLPLELHVRRHHPNSKNRKFGERNTLILCRCGCGQLIKKYDLRGRPRSRVCGHSTRC
mgnify:CR=1 FL=1